MCDNDPNISRYREARSLRNRGRLREAIADLTPEDFPAPYDAPIVAHPLDLSHGHPDPGTSPRRGATIPITEA